MIAEQLHNAIAAVCPIDGVSIGVTDDKSTWRIDFKPEATSQQIAAAQAVIQSFVFTPPAPAPDPLAALQQQVAAQQAVITQLLASIQAANQGG